MNKITVQIIHCLDENEPPEVFVYESDLYQYEILLAIREEEIKKIETETEAKIKKIKTQFQEERRRRTLRIVDALIEMEQDIPAIAEILDISIDEATGLVHQIETQKP